MRKEALWLLSNVAANSEKDATEIIKRGLIPNIVYAARDKNNELKKEALWVLANIC